MFITVLIRPIVAERHSSETDRQKSPPHSFLTKNIDGRQCAGTLESMMSPEKIARYRATMEKEREKLLAQLKEAEKPEDFGDDVDDIDSIEAEEAEEMGNKLAIGQAIRDRLAEIEEALLKIEKGESLTEEYLDKVSGLHAA